MIQQKQKTNLISSKAQQITEQILDLSIVGYNTQNLLKQLQFKQNDMATIHRSRFLFKMMTYYAAISTEKVANSSYDIAAKHKYVANLKSVMYNRQGQSIDYTVVQESIKEFDKTWSFISSTNISDFMEDSLLQKLKDCLPDLQQELRKYKVYHAKQSPINMIIQLLKQKDVIIQKIRQAKIKQPVQVNHQEKIQEEIVHQQPQLGYQQQVEVSSGQDQQLFNQHQLSQPRSEPEQNQSGMDIEESSQNQQSSSEESSSYYSNIESTTAYITHNQNNDEDGDDNSMYDIYNQDAVVEQQQQNYFD